MTLLCNSAASCGGLNADSIVAIRTHSSSLAPYFNYWGADKQTPQLNHKPYHSPIINPTINPIINPIIAPVQTGRVDPGVYIAYATKVLRGAHVPALILIQIAWQGLQISSDWWLAHSTTEESTTNPRHFIGVYALLAMSSGIFVLFR